MQSSGAELPFDDDSFDLVATFAVLHHLIDPAVVRGTLAEMVRVLRPGAGRSSGTTIPSTRTGAS